MINRSIINTISNRKSMQRVISSTKQQSSQFQETGHEFYAPPILELQCQYDILQAEHISRYQNISISQPIQKSETIQQIRSQSHEFIQKMLAELTEIYEKYRNGKIQMQKLKKLKDTEINQIKSEMEILKDENKILRSKVAFQEQQKKEKTNLMINEVKYQQKKFIKEHKKLKNSHQIAQNLENDLRQLSLEYEGQQSLIIQYQNTIEYQQKSMSSLSEQIQFLNAVNAKLSQQLQRVIEQCQKWRQAAVDERLKNEQSIKEITNQQAKEKENAEIIWKNKLREINQRVGSQIKQIDQKYRMKLSKIQKMYHKKCKQLKISLQQFSHITQKQIQKQCVLAKQSIRQLSQNNQ